MIEIADKAFVERDFSKALFYYAQLLRNYPEEKEFEILVKLADIGTENEDRAIFLHDYFIVSKNELGIEDATYLTNSFISAYDGNNDKLAEILQMMSNQEIEYLDAIKYSDFIELIKSRGSFRQAFEDIMYSTKVALNSKEEFYEFISQLIDNGFQSIAYTYLDGYNQMFQFDTKMQELYKKLEDKRVDNHIR